MTIFEILNAKAISWLDAFDKRNPDFTGIAKCPVTGENLCFVHGIRVEDYEYDRFIESLA